jgi:two-component system chemotaxis sensor kinase CheA
MTGDAEPVPAAAPEAASVGAASQDKAAPDQGAARTIRVDADRLGHLITLVGELIIASARTSLASIRLRDPELRDSTELLASLVEEVRDSALQLRMVRIGTTFRRFQRLVHDAARERHKEIRLQISGEEVELDKTLVERIADPLTHLVRNAIDHGIEPASERQARGKPAAGTITLNAHHDAGTIVIEVSDDGAGLAREKILEKAIAQGLATPGVRLPDSEVHALIFEPGFSTASEITSLSGRGVGMDVVKQNIEALRGSIAIDSTEGEGTTIRVRLPLTLAIVDCLLVRVGGSSFALPLSMVDECVASSPEEAGGLHQLRDEVLPVLVLRELFHLNGPPPRRESIVVVRHAGQKAGLVVDALLGQIQAVMKPLSPLLAGVRCISGSTILGSGEVALVLDLPTLLKQNKETTPC